MTDRNNATNELIKNIINSELTPDDIGLLINVLADSRRVKTALKVNEYFRLGHPLTREANGAYTLASEALGCHPSTCERHYGALFPKRSVMIEKKIKPALTFPIRQTG